MTIIMKFVRSVFDLVTSTLRKQIIPLKKELTSAQVLLSCFCCGASGILFVSSVLPLKLLATLILVCLLCALRNTYIRPLLFFLIGFLYTNFYVHHQLQQSFPEKFERMELNLNGTIIGLPKITNGDIKFRFKVTSHEIKGLDSLIDRSILLSCYRCPLSIEAGQRWRFTVRLKRPHGYASWGAFDYEKFLFRHGLVAKGYIRLKSPNYLVTEGAQAASEWRQNIRTHVVNNIPDSVGRNMVLALTIGDKSGFSNQQQTVFQNTGVSHLMAISGLHIGLVFLTVASFFGGVFRLVPAIFDLMPRAHLVLIPSFVAACFYASLAGFAVSTQRALVMLLVYVLCKISGRPLSLLNVLILAATILILFDPLSILDGGFWLSCGAVLIIALMCTQGQSASLIKLQPSLWLGMMPIGVVLFAKMSLISPFVNLIVVPIFCFLLIPLTLISIIFSYLDVVLSTFITHGLLHLIVSVFDYIFLALEWLSMLSIASRFTTPLLFWQWFLYVFLMVALVQKFHRATIVLSVLFLISILLRPVHRLENDEINILLLDVGQGLSMVIETPNSLTVYDTGAQFTSGFTPAEAVLLPYLRRRGLDRINTLIISHADNDHIGGYQKVQDNFKVERVLSSRVDKLPESELCRAGQQWHHDMTLFKVLGPDINTPQGSNNHSCVIKIEHHGTTILITGDIEKQVENYMRSTQAQNLASNIMLVPHQGSKTSSTKDFLDAVNPNIALLAAGYKNHYGHPHADVMKRYKNRNVDVYSTIESGSILLKINSQGWTVSQYRQDERKPWFN